MRLKIESYKTHIKDIIFELEYTKETTDIWLTREDFRLKIYMWGCLNKYEYSKEQIIEMSINSLLEDYQYWKDKLEL